MKIALTNHHVGGRSGGGGAVRLMLELGHGLAARGHDVTVAVAQYEPGGQFDYATEGLDLRAVRTGPVQEPDTRGELLDTYWREMRKVAALVPGDVDVVNGHDWLGLRPARIAANRLNTALVWTRNDETPWERGFAPELTIYGDTRRAVRAIRMASSLSDFTDGRRADEIVVLSRAQTRLVARCYRKRSTIVPMGPPSQFFDAPDRAGARRRLGIADDVFMVGAFGIIITHRRYEHLIEALALLKDDPSIQGMIGGSDHADPDYANRLEALIAERGLTGRVHLPRRSLSEAEMRDMYTAPDVFTILNKRYAWGLSPLEALASGTPVLVSAGAQVSEVLEGRPGAAIEPMEDPAATAAAIRRWRNGEGRVGIEQTQEWLARDLSMDAYVSQMEAVYERVVAERRSR